MKKIILAVAISGLLATSCSRTFENKEIKYNANVKGFFKMNDEDNKPAYDMLTITEITDDWDGDETYSPNSGDEKLIKVSIHGNTTIYGEDLGFTEASMELYNIKDKVAFKPLLSLKKGSTFKGVSTGNESGFVVYSIPLESDFSNLYIGLNRGLSELKWEDESEETLLPLKKVQYDFAENVMSLDVVKTVEEGWNGESIKYSFKSITFNCDDENVKEFKKDEFNKDNFFARLDIDLENLSDKELSMYTSVPYLVSEYKVISEESNLPSLEDKLAPLEKKTQTIYYTITPGVKHLGFIRDGKYSIEFK